MGAICPVYSLYVRVLTGAVGVAVSPVPGDVVAEPVDPGGAPRPAVAAVVRRARVVRDAAVVERERARHVLHVAADRLAS